MDHKQIKIIYTCTHVVAFSFFLNVSTSIEWFYACVQLFSSRIVQIYVSEKNPPVQCNKWY